MGIDQTIFKRIHAKKMTRISWVLALIMAIGACERNTNSADANSFGLSVPAIGDRAIARVNGTLITAMDIEREAALQNVIQPGDPLSPQSVDFPRILNELIDQRLLALEAIRRGLGRDTETMLRLRIARERILGNVLVERAIADAVTENAVQRLYEEQANLSEPGEEVRARHILVETRNEAVEVQQLVKAGGNFASLAFEYSKDAATRLEGGDLGFFNQESMVEPFANAAFLMKVGELSGPIQTRYGWHIIRIEARRKAKIPGLEEMRPRIVRFMTFDEIQKLVTDLHDTANIEILEKPVEIPQISLNPKGEPKTTDPDNMTVKPTEPNP
ncbi:MAG: peptidylprolyl isomerase [Robiginitomaculum sp.]|nr:MAG: peptidylprolyl isomerase [Robiginitomaculum sp.]